MSLISSSEKNTRLLFGESVPVVSNPA